MNTLNKLCGFASVQFWSGNGSGPILYKNRFLSKPQLVGVEALKRTCMPEPANTSHRYPSLEAFTKFRIVIWKKVKVAVHNVRWKWRTSPCDYLWSVPLIANSWRQVAFFFYLPAIFCNLPLTVRRRKLLSLNLMRILSILTFKWWQSQAFYLYSLFRIGKERKGDNNSSDSDGLSLKHTYIREALIDFPAERHNRQLVNHYGQEKPSERVNMPPTRSKKKHDVRNKGYEEERPAPMLKVGRVTVTAPTRV